MERIWTPWRIKYIMSEKPKTCIICDKAREKSDKENYIVHRGERGFIMLNLYPYNNGHLLVSPYQHEPSLELLGPETLNEMMSLVALGLRLLRRTMNPGGFNVGVNIGKPAGAGIDDHVHIHVVPRWEGDTNFMPIISETRVIPELLDSTYERLMGALKDVIAG